MDGANELPYFDYADIVYDKANQKDLDKLQRAQNKCLKICLKANTRTDTNLIHSTTKSAKLQYRRKVHLRNFMYSKLNDDHLIDSIPVNTRSRDAPLFKIKFPNNEEVSNIMVLWNGTIYLL